MTRIVTAVLARFAAHKGFIFCTFSKCGLTATLAACAATMTIKGVEIINNVKKELEQHPMRQARIAKGEAENEAYESRMREIFPEDYR